MSKIRISLAQINPVVGDIKRNYKKIMSLVKKFASKTDLIVFPEMSLVGYPPEDLVLREKFINEAQHYYEKICINSKEFNVAILIGLPLKFNNGIGNSAAFIVKGKKKVIFKNSLPNYGVFDEKRVFVPGNHYKCIVYRKIRFGILICEDLWSNNLPTVLKRDQADIFICINASPYDYQKKLQRFKVAKKTVVSTSKPLFYVNQIGGQDELVFDGNSFLMNSKGQILDNMLPWKEQVKTYSYVKKDNTFSFNKSPPKSFSEEYDVWNALVLGLKDYVLKNSFNKVVLGLSGGIDSAVSAAIAVDALGNNKVHGLLMPSKYSTNSSLKDAKETADLLGITTDTIRINSTHKNYLSILKKHFNNELDSLTEENLQSRIRGIYLMAFSNNFSYLLLSTGNKSEMSVGYSTIYGDMNGGFNVLKDIYKTEVYKLANWRNSFSYKSFKGSNSGMVIPINSIVKPPSAELKHNQKDSDTLPDYNILDKILFFLNEKDLSIDQVVKKGYEKKIVTKVRNLFIKSEYKRRQAPPGIKISTKSFGKERRYPITNIFKN